MICKNCGSDNIRGAKHCSECNFPLSGGGHASLKTPAPAPKEEPAHQPEIVPQNPVKSHSVKKTCPQCKYELIFDAAVCPMCSFNFHESDPFVTSTKEQPPAPAPVAALPKTELTEIKPEQPAVPPAPPEAPKPQVVAQPNPEPHFPEIMHDSTSADTVPVPTYADALNESTDEAPLPSAGIKSGSNTLNKSIRHHSKPTTSPFTSKKGHHAAVEGTIDPFRSDQASIGIAWLRPVAREGEMEQEPISLAGNVQPLPVNRAILEPENNTITSKTQATFEFRDGEWYITDGSDQQTTFVRAAGPVKLKNGDIILMGNRKFIFDC